MKGPFDPIVCYKNVRFKKKKFYNIAGGKATNN